MELLIIGTILWHSTATSYHTCTKCRLYLEVDINRLTIPIDESTLRIRRTSHTWYQVDSRTRTTGTSTTMVYELYIAKLGTIQFVDDISYHLTLLASIKTRLFCSFWNIFSWSTCWIHLIMIQISPHCFCVSLLNTVSFHGKKTWWKWTFLILILAYDWGRKSVSMLLDILSKTPFRQRLFHSKVGDMMRNQ